MSLDTIGSTLLEDLFAPLEIRLANGDRHAVEDPFDVAVPTQAARRLAPRIRL